MAKATTNQTDISYAVETVPGVTPDTPVFQILPTTGGSPALKITTQVSDVIRSDRQIDDLIPVDADASAELNYELSYEAYKPMLEQLMRESAVTATVALTDAVATTATSTFTTTAGDFVAGGIVAGMHVRVSGSSHATLNRVYRVTTVVAKTLTVSPAPLENATSHSLSMDSIMLRNGFDAPITNTLMKRVIAPSGVTSYFYYMGMAVSKMVLNFALGSKLTGVLSFMGRTEEVTTTPKVGQTINDYNPYVVMNAASNIQEIVVEGLPMTTCFQKLDLTIDNGTTGSKCIGTFGASDVQDFSLNVTGAIETYFEDITSYTMFKNSGSFFLSIWLEDSDGNGMVFSMPKCKFEDLSLPVPGKDQFLSMPGTIRALRDENYGTIQIDLFPAP